MGKLGIIGLGSMGKIHLLNCLNLINPKNIVVGDKSKNALKYARDLGIQKTYQDFNELLKNDDISEVIISLPNFLHLECAIAAAEAGKNILLEKPIARTVVEGEKILRSIKNAGIKFMLGYPSRFSTEFNQLKNDLDNGLLGEIQIANATNISSGPFVHRVEEGGPAVVPQWWFNKSLVGGGVLLDLGIHYVNLLKWYFGEVDEVKSYLGYRFNLDIEDYSICLLRFKNGPIATINVGWFSKDYKICVDLYGTVKHISIIPSYKKRSKIIFQDIKRKMGLISSPNNNFFKEIKYFLNCVKTDTMPFPSGDDGLSDLKIIEKAYRNSIKYYDDELRY